jgi:2-oxoglutarate ferredoxin oxidoreductase subunit delta
MAKSRGFVAVNTEECKGCKLCVDACPVDVLSISSLFNVHGYNHAEYEGQGCTGCGVCFYACPEPGALVVFKNWEKVRMNYHVIEKDIVIPLQIKDAKKGIAMSEDGAFEVDLSQFKNLHFTE